MSEHLNREQLHSLISALTERSEPSWRVKSDQPNSAQEAQNEAH